MASVFPWTQGSPLLLAGIVLALLLWIALSAWGYQRLRRVVQGQRDQAEGRGQLLSPRTWDHVGTGLFVAAVGATAYGVLYASTWVHAPLRGLVFDPAVRLLPSLLLLGLILLGTAVALDTTQQLARFLRGELPRRPKRALSPQVVNVVHLSLRYLLFLSAGIGFAVTAMALLGYQDVLAAKTTEWFSAQASALLLLAVLIGVGWAGGRVIRAVMGDLRTSSRRLSPDVVDAMGAIMRGALYAFVGIIAAFTILSAVGLGSIGGTMVVVLSTFIGLVVAMAATGSIGNALAGMVILAFKPFQKGDRVVVQTDLVGDVEEISVMFTRIRTVSRELVDVPNNLVLLHRVRNLSRSGRHAIVVKIGIGYEVSHELVRRLARDAAGRTERILKEPKPEVYAVTLGNYAIEYELHAFTDEPRHIKVRSDLLGHLQEAFYAAGVEIMTPNIYVIRPGKKHEEEGMVTVQVQGPRETSAPESP